MPPRTSLAGCARDVRAPTRQPYNWIPIGTGLVPAKPDHKRRQGEARADDQHALEHEVPGVVQSTGAAVGAVHVAELGEHQRQHYD